jgi:hypothetical protein
MPDLDFSLKHLQESGAQASPLQVDGCNSIWLLDDDASLLRALGRLVKAAGFSVEKFNPSNRLSLQAQTSNMSGGSHRRVDARHEWLRKCKPASSKIRRRHGSFS